ncbi:MAG: alpha/beta hydrolase, partial [Planctomycetota bacterium]
EMGYNCFLAEYRGYGMSSGAPELGKMLADVEKIMAAIGQPPEELVLFGRSVGSIFAIHAASLFPQAAGLILESGIADPLERLLMRIRPEELGVDMESLRRVANQDLNHEKKLSQFRNPALILHTRFDGLVDLSNGERLHAWIQGPKKLTIFEAGDHNSILFTNAREYFQLMQDFLDSLTD